MKYLMIAKYMWNGVWFLIDKYGEPNSLRNDHKNNTTKLE